VNVGEAITAALQEQQMYDLNRLAMEVEPWRPYEDRSHGGHRAALDLWRCWLQEAGNGTHRKPVDQLKLRRSR
jgi:hypothetical protein